MCLYIKRREPRIAKFNIPVYKILEKNGLFLQTPFTQSLINLRQPLIAYGITTINDLCCRDVSYINVGVIHCFWNKYCVHKYLKLMEKVGFNPSNLVIQKAYIPKGTLFFIGRYKSFGEIGAKKIIFKL